MKSEAEILERINSMHFEDNVYFKESSSILGMFINAIKKLMISNWPALSDLSSVLKALNAASSLLLDTIIQKPIENQNKEKVFLQIKTNLLSVTREYFKIVNNASPDKVA